MISKSGFMQAAALRRGAVSIDALGGDIEIVELDLQTRGELMAMIKDSRHAGIGALILAHCVPVLDSPTPDEIAAISPAVTEQITAAVFALSGLSDDAPEEAVKNSDSDPSASLRSA